ncbi:MAG TPA: hypothetical protein VGH27_09755 [Streptosporangiaceae bacterium]|jgi:hypothetical protein
MPQQACIFCGRAKPLVAITKEHLFSRWVDSILTPELLGPDRTYERTTTGPDGITTTRTWPTEVIAAIESAVVCGNCQDGCNEGWMGGLDGQIKHLLKPMMLGSPRTLTPAQQLTIATWAAMKSMVLEYFWQSVQVIVFPQSARTFVFHAQRPPENMQVRIAAVESHGRPALISRRVYQLRPKAPGSAALPGFASCSTLVLGCFVVQTYGTSIVSPAASQHPHGRNYFAIHPPTGHDINWPPPELLDDAGLDEFAHPLQPITGG